MVELSKLVSPSSSSLGSCQSWQHLQLSRAVQQATGVEGGAAITWHRLRLQALSCPSVPMFAVQLEQGPSWDIPRDGVTFFHLKASRHDKSP